MAVLVVLAVLRTGFGLDTPPPAGRCFQAARLQPATLAPSTLCRQATPLVSSLRDISSRNGNTLQEKHLTKVLPMAHPRTRSISTRVTADEYAACERLAGTRSVGLWLHDVLRATLTSAPARDLIVVGEVLGLRMIVLNLHHDMARGERPTDERVHDIIATADREKLRMAKARLAEPFLL
jgi:hypothetical protein